MSEPLVFSEEDLTIGDLETFERITGKSLFEFVEAMKAANGALAMNGDTVRMVKALVVIVKQKTDPGFTEEDAAKVKLSELVLAPSGVDPTAASV